MHNERDDLYVALAVPLCVPTHPERSTLDSSGPRRL